MRFLVIILALALWLPLLPLGAGGVSTIAVVTSAAVAVGVVGILAVGQGDASPSR